MQHAGKVSLTVRGGSAWVAIAGLGAVVVRGAVGMAGALTVGGAASTMAFADPQLGHFGAPIGIFAPHLGQAMVAPSIVGGLKHMILLSPVRITRWSQARLRISAVQVKSLGQIGIDISEME